MKKIMLFMFVMIFLVGTVSAVMEWDNVLDYENDDMTVIITNWLGLGEELGEAELTSHSSVDEVLQVIRGKDRAVMYYDFNFSESYIDGLGEVIYTNMKTGKKIQKDYYFAKEIREDVLVPDYKTNCVVKQDLGNGTILEDCSRDVIGNHIENKFIGWKKLNNNDIPKGIIRIALITDVKPNDYIDGVWTIAGKKVSLHSEWTDSLNTGLVAYYNFDEVNGSTILVNNLGNATFDGTYFGVGESTSWVTGLLGNSFNFSPESQNYFNMTYSMDSLNGSINFWVNPNDITGDVWLGRDPTGTIDGEFLFGSVGAGPVWRIGDGGSFKTLTADSNIQTNGSWTMVTITWNSTGYQMYLNATKQSTFLATTQGPVNAFGCWGLGAKLDSDSCGTGGANPLNGTMDEFGYWNIELNQTQVTQLHNDGIGITFPITITLNSPVDTFNTTNQTIDFNGTVVNADGIVNVTLFIDGVKNETITTPSSLVGYWNLDDNLATTNVIDGSGNGNDGTATFNTENNSVGGQIISALTFNGSGSSSIVTIPDDSAFDIASGLTVCLWFNMNNASYSNNFVSKWAGGSPNNRSWNIGVPSNSRLRFFTSEDGTSGALKSSTSLVDLENNTWYHGCGVWTGTQLLTYVDGSASGVGSTTAVIFEGDSPIEMGRPRVEANGINGTMDDIQLYNEALNSSQIKNIYDLGVIGRSNIGSGGDYLFTKVIADGNHNWTYESCNDNSCTTATTRTFTIDTIFPIVDVTSPTGDQGTFVSGRNLTLSWNVTEANPDTCIYEYDGINTTVACSLNTTNLTITDNTKTSLIFYVNDTLGQSNFNTTSWSYSFIENNVTFNENVSETSSQFFEINLSTSSSVLSISSQLNYDGTNYFSTSACGDFCLVNNTIDIPLVSAGESELKSFFWDINIFNGTDSISVNTTTRTQNVSRIHLETCDATFTTQSLNFTTYNEQNLIRINPFTFDGTFDIWLGSGDVKRNNSFNNPSIAEKTLCIFPNATYFVDSQIEYNEPANITYVTRNYYFQNDTISNVSQDIFLYLLKSSSSTSFILKVQDDNLLPLEDHIIIIQRFYPGEDLFRTVQIAKTSENGKTIGFFETEIVDYRFIIKLNGQTLLTTTQQKIVGEVAPFTLTFTIGLDLGKPWKTLEDLTKLAFSLIFNKSTNVVTYTYVDTSGNFTLGTLIVQKQNFSFSTNTNLCALNSSQASATLTCNLTSNGTGTFVAKGFVTRGSVETLISQINFIIESFLEVVGMLGVLLAWFLILISSFAFKFNEIAGLFMINATVIFVNIIGLVSFGMLAISALIGASIIIVVVMEK